MTSNKPFHICLNLIGDPNWHAGNIYIHNIVEAISLLPEQERKSICLSVALHGKSTLPESIASKTDHVYYDSVLRLITRTLLRKLPGFLRLNIFNDRKIDFYYPAGNLPRRWPFAWAGWIPDFQYRHFPELFSETEVADRDRRNRFLACESKLLAFSSQHAIEDYYRFFPEYKGNEYLLHFVSRANPDWLQKDAHEVRKSYQLPERFYLVCNQFWKHKDHATVIRALSRLKKQGLAITVACTGSTEDFRNPDYFPSLLKLAKDLDVSDQFIVVGFISRSDQIQLIRACLAIIQPSLFEGWSTVVEDGRALGKTILLSDFPVHVEQQPPFVHYFECRNDEQLATIIEEQDKFLTPGPDLLKEQHAFATNGTMMLDFGRRFIAMAKSLSK